MTSVSSTEIQVAETHWATANAKPTTRAIGQVCFMPRLPSTRATSMSGTNRARTGVWWPTYAPISL